MEYSAEGVLEFEELRALLGRYVRSALGRAVLEQLEPAANRTEAVERLEDMAEALAWAGSVGSKDAAAKGAAVRIRFEAPPEPDGILAIVRIEGAVLDGKQLRDLLQLLDLSAEARGILSAAAARFPRLWGIGGALADLRPLARDIGSKLLPDGSLADDASVLLGRLRRDIERQQKTIQSALEQFLRLHRGDGTLREDLVTIRGDRFVVPVVAGQQRKAEGVIHGASGSGQTLFVEPLETIGLNNEMVRLREEEAREQHRILREFTARLRPEAGSIAASLGALGRLEFLFAAADFGIEFDCSIPALSPVTGRRLALDRARHPLLEDVLRARGGAVVPVSLELSEARRTLLISGPNTGGKTVALKTVGLLAMMARSGLPVPAAAAEFPWFDRILADVGDHQSIAESLSSFSAHMAGVRSMLEAAGPESLVLLDELGRATDPEEGGALGVAILDTFRRMGAFTLASTHLLALKVYGTNTPGVVNGSMGFDDETLAPTYVLRLGAPGKSAGLAIASRLGLPAELIDRARQTMSSQERDIARLLDELHRRAESYRAREDELAREKQEWEAREKALAEEARKRERTKLREMEERGAAAIAAFDRQARETIDDIARLAEQRKAAAQAERKAARVKREFQELLQQAAGPEVREAPARIEEGARVRLRGVREPATVRRLLGNGRLEVQAGLMKMQVEAGDIEEVLGAGAAPASLPANVSFRPAGPSWDVSYREINVIGQKAEEAVAQVDKFLDSASMASVDRVRIVHGHGMGILKRAIAELLQSNPHVEKFYPASPAEGGTGATVAELK